MHGKVDSSSAQEVQIRYQYSAAVGGSQQWDALVSGVGCNRSDGLNPSLQ